MLEMSGGNGGDGTRTIAERMQIAVAVVHWPGYSGDLAEMVNHGNDRTVLENGQVRRRGGSTGQTLAAVYNRGQVVYALFLAMATHGVWQ